VHEAEVFSPRSYKECST